MRWNLALVPALSLLCSAAAQGANQVPLSGNAPQQTFFQEKAQMLFEQGKRLAKVYLGNTPVDVEARDYSDREAGVIRLTDENWDREMAAWDGDWAIVIHGHQFGPAISDPTSGLFMTMHDNATRMAMEYIASPPLEKDGEEKLANLKRVKWARFDYITEWQWCARWMITRPPWMLFVTNHGQDVRFLGPRSISAEGRKLFSFMSYRNWESLTTWKPIPLYSRCAEYYIYIAQQISKGTSTIPSWVWLLVVPTVMQGLVKYIFFGNEEATAQQPARAPKARAPGAVPAAKKKA